MAFQSVRHASAFVSANIITDIWKNMFFCSSVCVIVLLHLTIEWWPFYTVKGNAKFLIHFERKRSGTW